MEIPVESHPAWLRAISGQGAQNIGFLATKLLLGRLSQQYKRDSSPAMVRLYVSELRGFFVKNAKLPKAMDDLKCIINGR
jgi:hypothetical protein